jgi:RNA polymerase sigma-70 factor (ECF subfamily)
MPASVRERTNEERRMTQAEYVAKAQLAGELCSAEPAMDSEAFAAFYRRSARPLRAYLARVSGDAALADDLMQEAYLRFLASPPRTEGETDARRYLFRIGTNLLRDHWRRPATTALADLPETALAADDGSAGSDALAMLTPAMARLRPRERQLLWLAHAEGYSHAEIASITGLARASIRLLLFRARRRMVRLLEKRES